MIRNAEVASLNKKKKKNQHDIHIKLWILLPWVFAEAQTIDGFKRGL